MEIDLIGLLFLLVGFAKLSKHSFNLGIGVKDKISLSNLPISSLEFNES